MAEGHVRGADATLKPECVLPRRRGAERSVKPLSALPPGNSDQIVDRTATETPAQSVHDGDGGTGNSVEPDSRLSPVATTESEAVSTLKPRAGLPRRQKTASTMKPRVTLSSGPPIDPPTAPGKAADGASRTMKPVIKLPRRGTEKTLKPDTQLSPGTPIADRLSPETHKCHVREGDGGTGDMLKPKPCLPPVADTIQALKALQRTRTLCIRRQSVTDRSTEHFIARECFGYHTKLPEAQRKALMHRAKLTRLAGERPLMKSARKGRLEGENHNPIALGDERDHPLLETRESVVPPVDPLDPDAQDAAGDHSMIETQLLGVPGDGRDLSRFANRKGFVPPVDPTDADDEDTDGDRGCVELRERPVPSGDGTDQGASEAQSIAVPPVAAPIITMSFYARSHADQLRRVTERQMEELAETLPVARWRKKITGFGALGLAVIIAEAGNDLRRFPTVSKLWKRLGLAVIDGERQRRKTDPELALLHGYVPRRRAEMWTLADSMFRHQWRGGEAQGPYGEAYAKRRERTLVTHPEWTKPHQRDDAKRVMFKALIADLWGAWHNKPRPVYQQQPGTSEIRLGMAVPRPKKTPKPQ